MKFPYLGAIVGVLMLAAACATAPRVDAPAPAAPPAAPAEPVVALPTLIEWLSSPDATVRAQAAWSLYQARGAEAEVLPALRPLVDDEVREVRYAARWSIVHLDKMGLSLPQDGGTPPRLLVGTSPIYPRAAFERAISGTVQVEMLIGEEGEVAYAVVKKSIPALDEAALACVRKWRFEPARRSGKPISAVAEVPVRFSLR